MEDHSGAEGLEVPGLGLDSVDLVGQEAVVALVKLEDWRSRRVRIQGSH